MISVADSPMTEDGLRFAARVVRCLTGVVVPHYRWPVLRAEVERIGGGGFDAGIQKLSAGDGRSLTDLLNSVTIPETYFFRHRGHFALLRDIAKDRASSGRATGVLCAGCSTGEEAWSAAAVLASVPVSGPRAHVVEGWELSEDRISRAEAGRYGSWSCREGLAGFDEMFPPDGDERVAHDRLRTIARFRRVNLLADEFDAARSFDVVFLRNVTIYWSDEAVEIVSSKLEQVMAPDGLLLVGPTDPVLLSPERWTHRIADGVRFFERARPRAAALSPAEPVAQPAPPLPGRPPAAVVFGGGITPNVQNELEQPIDEDCRDDLDRVRKLADQGRYEAALDLLRWSDAGESVEGKLWAGILHVAVDEPRRALTFFRQCVFLGPTVAEYRRWLAVAFEALGKTEDAARELRNVASMGGS